MLGTSKHYAVDPNQCEKAKKRKKWDRLKSIKLTSLRMIVHDTYKTTNRANN